MSAARRGSGARKRSNEPRTWALRGPRGSSLGPDSTSMPRERPPRGFSSRSVGDRRGFGSERLRPLGMTRASIGKRWAWSVANGTSSGKRRSLIGTKCDGDGWEMNLDRDGCGPRPVGDEPRSGRDGAREGRHVQPSTRSEPQSGRDAARLGGDVAAIGGNRGSIGRD